MLASAGTVTYPIYTGEMEHLSHTGGLNTRNETTTSVKNWTKVDQMEACSHQPKHHYFGRRRTTQGVWFGINSNASNSSQVLTFVCVQIAVK
jgi:hypothetical protein